MHINRNNIGGWVRDCLAWRLDQDIEGRINSQIDRAIEFGHIGIRIGNPGGARVPRGVEFNGDVGLLQCVAAAIDHLPVVPRLILMAHYWPVRDTSITDTIRDLGVSRDSYYRTLQHAEQDVYKKISNTH